MSDFYACYSLRATNFNLRLVVRDGLALLFWGGVVALKGPVERGQVLYGCSHVEIV